MKIKRYYEGSNYYELLRDANIYDINNKNLCVGDIIIFNNKKHIIKYGVHKKIYDGSTLYGIYVKSLQGFDYYDATLLYKLNKNCTYLSNAYIDEKYSIFLKDKDIDDNIEYENI